MPTVVELLLARAARRSTAPHGDGASIALCVEGGAMRGVVSAGMVSALEALGLTTAFDAVYGSSAGAFNAAYFLAGQAALGTTIYHDDINTRAFISFARPLFGRPIVDLGFFVDDVATRRKQLDTGRVLASSSPLAVLATDVDSSAATAFRGFADARDLLQAMRAGSTMPVIAGGAFAYRGRRYLDASLSEPIPLPTAEAAAHTHVLVLLTRPAETARALSRFDRWYVVPRLARISEPLARRYATRMGPYASLVERIASGRALNGAIVLGIRPAAAPVGKLERRRAILMAAAAEGYQAVMRVFGAA